MRETWGFLALGYGREGGRMWLAQLTSSANPTQGARKGGRQLFWDGTTPRARPQRWAVEERGQRVPLPQ